ncbi:MAG: nucleotidyltransferase family protein [Anaerolineales bacterium]|nr:nucleotidyltransferase family protein [Anaerolineales bacterium]
MKALILAAGKGTRLKSLTADRPKPMLPVGDEPLLAHHVRRLRDAGVEEIAINLHHAADVITDYFGDGSRFGVRLVYSYEPELMGTAGAAKILESFLDTTYFVVYGDVFTNIGLVELAQFHADHKQQRVAPMALTMSLYRVPNPTECGLVEVDSTGRVTRFVEKPPADQVFTDLANAGILVCDPAVMAITPAATVFDFGRDLIPLMLEQGGAVFGKAITDEEYVIDIGTPAGFERAQTLANGQRLPV